MLNSYDPTILGQFAARLLAKAERIVIAYGTLGFLVAGALFAFFYEKQMGVAVLSATFVISVALYLGNERAFAYRVQAQTVLCQVAIEMNTRQLVITTQMHAAPPRPY